MGLPLLPHLRRQMPLRIRQSSLADYETASSLYLRQSRQSLKLGDR